MSKPVILCVDDEKVILDSLKVQIKKAFNDAFVYETAESADEALELIEELQDEEMAILVIVSDWLMPGMKGDELLARIHQKYPKIVKIMLTGQADLEAITKAKDVADLHSCLYKPWHSQDLIETIKSGLAKL